MTSAETLLPAADSARLRAKRVRDSAHSARDSAAVPGRARRGPFRPDLWLNTRQRNATRRRVFYFRGLDILGVGAVTLAGFAVLSGGAPLSARLIDAAPLGLGALAILVLLRSLGLYRFDKSHGLLSHLASVACVVAIGAAAAACLGFGWHGASTPWSSYGSWAAGVLALLLATHAAWSLLVSDWRRRGALTPNIVVVGATRHAERLIQEALQRRDLNVLGVFDDRLARSPDAVEGVPVLGEADALLNHRLTPYVDRIVLAIDPKAEARVRDLTARLGALPIRLTLLIDPKTAEQRNAALEDLAQAPMAPAGRPRCSRAPPFQQAATGCRAGVHRPDAAVASLADRRPVGPTGQSGPCALSPTPARLQSGRNRGVEVPHHAARRRRRDRQPSGHG